MSREYAVAPITPDQVDRAYVLVRLSEPHMTIEEWREVCGPGNHAFQDGGAPWQVAQVLVAKGPRGYVHGLAIVGRMKFSDGGRMIEVPAFVAPSAVDPVGVSRALLDALVKVCREHSCDRLSVRVPPGEEDAYAALGRASAALGVGPRRLTIDLHAPAPGSA